MLGLQIVEQKRPVLPLMGLTDLCRVVRMDARLTNAM